jgi:glutaconate CoA-transferase subunit B
VTIESNFSLEELLACAVCRELKQGELAFIGMGTGGKAFILAVGVPTVACRLAQLTHAPNFTFMFGPVINPDIENPPRSERDFASWRCQSLLPARDCLSVFKRGAIDVGFIAGAQIDKFGNTNTVAIGEYRKPKVRLVGCIAHTDHCAYAGRTIVMMRHAKRSFVERVDFITGVGYLDGKNKARAKTGLTTGGGPAKVFTDLAVMDFDPETRQMRLSSLHPGVAIDQVMENTGFNLIVPKDIPSTPGPSKQQLELIRNKIDPNGSWLNAGLTGSPTRLTE